MKIKVLLKGYDLDASYVKICEDLNKNSFKVYQTNTNKIEFVKNHIFKSNGWEVHLHKLSITYAGTVEFINTKRGLWAIIHIKNKVGFLYRAGSLLVASIIFSFFRLEYGLLFFLFLYCSHVFYICSKIIFLCT